MHEQTYSHNAVSALKKAPTLYIIILPQKKRGEKLYFFQQIKIVLVQAKPRMVKGGADGGSGGLYLQSTSGQKNSVVILATRSIAQHV